VPTLETPMSPGGSQASAGEGLSPCNIGILVLVLMRPVPAFLACIPPSPHHTHTFTRVASLLNSHPQHLHKCSPYFYYCYAAC